jgi:signal transduction histidine kinase
MSGHAAGPHDRAIPRDSDGARRLDAALAIVVMVLAAASLAVWLTPQLPRVVRAPELDIAINVTATLVGAAVAILAWARWRETNEPASLYECSAFVVLATTNAYLLVVVILGAAASFGLDPGAPTSAPVYAWTLARLSSAILLIIGGLRGLRGQRAALPPPLIALLPGVALLVVAALLGTLASAIPAISGLDQVVFGAAPELGESAQRTVGSIGVAAGELLVCLLYLIAARNYRTLYRRDGQLGQAFLSVGLVVAATGQLQFAVDPVVSAQLVTSADILRLGFAAILFLGIVAEFQADLASLRRANRRLEDLRDVDAANAALAERARLAREIHDGLAQDLWYAKLKQSRIAAAPELAAETRTTAREVGSALDAALAEARQAVMAMRAEPTAAGLADVLERYVEDFGDRFGLHVVFEAVEPSPPLPARVEAEILRVVQEALNNCRKHADAAVVRVRLDVDGGRLRITVADNGRGFEPTLVPTDRYGLRSMAERAELVGASLGIESAPSDGTRVTLDVPLAAGPAGPAASVAPDRAATGEPAAGGSGAVVEPSA